MSVYFVTGTAQGVGLGLVQQLSSDPTNTVLAAVRTTSQELSDLARKHSNIHIVTCDISSEAFIKSLSTTLPPILGDKKITHIINNAAIVSHPDLTSLTLTPAAITSNITTNVTGPALIVSTLFPFLSDSPTPLIINVSSGIASLTLVSNGAIPPNITSYSISKAALNMLTVHQAQHLKGRARVVALDPGHVKTRLGGIGANVEIGESAAGILRVMKGLEKEEGVEGGRKDRVEGRARFMNFLGEEVAW